ncbi:MutS-related protein [Candidatus Methylocalor cossyra]|uniref:DNA mismatch repair protein MutS n=1 Tax=Candidatus Methylocalor cossyra TaxID=3108543 RepID=A0ABM9NJL0_9GAMM
MKELVNGLYPTLLQADAKAPPAIRRAPGQGQVVDPTTFQTIEVDKLFDSVNHATTHLGQATLYRSLAQPLASPELIRAKQDSVRELAADPALRQGLEALVGEAKALERDFFDLLFGSFIGLLGAPAHEREIEGYGYASYLKGTRFLVNLADRAARLPTPGSDYLRILVDDLRDFAQSRAYALAKGPVYRTERGIATRAEKKWYTPAIRFRPSLFKPVALTLTVVLLFLALEFAPLLLQMAASVAPMFWLFLLPLGFLYIPIVGAFDRDGCIYPLRDSLRKSEAVHNVLDSLGKLDELLSFIRFKEAFGHPMTLPEVVEGDRHVLALTGVRNPVLAKYNPDYVPNDIDLGSERLTFITGPNSGGKTAFCKTLAQTQLLAQIGGYVPAERARLTVADHIYYQVPEISHLADGEGRFGTELRRTKDIFLAASPRSLVIMDELSEGTTHEEKIEISMDILEGFRLKGNSTILITHNHELVDRFRERGIGLARQVEFQNEQPTYRLVEGVSRVSHADRVARKIGFAKEDIARYLSGQA